MVNADEASQGDAAENTAGPQPHAETIAHLFHEHNRALVGYLRARLRSEQEAKEVAQEAYVRLLQLQKPGTPGLLRAYVFKTATNIATDRLRHRRVRQRAEQAELFEGLSASNHSNDPADQLLARERTEQLRRSLEELPAKCRQIFHMHRLEGLDQRAVADRAGVSERMVRRYVTYALVYCRLRLDGLSAEQARQEVEL
jgi:RNA polymerase sigma factor (sigma-70 family)